ncbi:MAG: biotin/lipoyl-binding protein [Gemmatimonadetes bacterium]|nr:biotin/lipoyl-binding protein [Gemmatimonadota bacterium]
MIYHVAIGKRTFEVKLGPDGVEIDGVAVDIDLAGLEGTAVRSLLMDGDSHRLLARRECRGRWDVHVGGHRFQAEVLDERAMAIREITAAVSRPVGPSPVRAPMPGLVVRVEVSVDDIVTAGQGVAIIEAMKMENELTAEVAARISAVHVAQGDAVKRGQVLVELAAIEQDEQDAP